MPVAKVPTKRMKTEIKTLRKGLAAEGKKSAKAARTVKAKTATLSKDMEKLKAEMENLSKKKTPKKQLSEYNLFMRRQLNAGKTFNQAVRLWKAYKSGKPLVKTKVVKKTIVRRVQSKPKVVTRTRTIIRRIASKPKIVTRTVVRNVQSKPKVITKTRTIIRKVPVTKTRTVVRTIRVPAAQPASRQTDSRVFETIISQMQKNEVEKMHLPDEELAVRLVSLYFEEIARMGFKRQLELDDVINAYYHALSKLKSRKTETTTQLTVSSNQPIIVESKQ